MELWCYSGTIPEATMAKSQAKVYSPLNYQSMSPLKQFIVYRVLLPAASFSNC